MHLIYPKTYGAFLCPQRIGAKNDEIRFLDKSRFSESSLPASCEYLWFFTFTHWHSGSLGRYGLFLRGDYSFQVQSASVLEQILAALLDVIAKQQALSFADD